MDLSMPILRSLLGCDFGTKVCVPGVDDKPCTLQATQTVLLWDNGVPSAPMKFCAGHFAFMETQTTPRENESEESQ